MNNTNKTGFYDPLDGLPDNNVLRTSTIYKIKTTAFLQGLRGRVGTTQITANLLIEKLANELRKHGITEYDPDIYELAVGGCTITLGLHGSAAERAAAGSEPVSAVEAPQGNDGRGAVGMGRTTTGTPDKRTNTSSARPGNTGQKRKSKVGTQSQP